MAPPPPSATITLSYPIYSSDFDPRNDGFLFSGGGGGVGRSGVKNKITLIDTSKKEEIKEVVDIDLSNSEDAVMSLAVAQSEDSFVTVLAGINSSLEEQRQGKNEHLRSFVLQYPQRRESADEKAIEIPNASSGALIEPLIKSPLFTPDTRPNPETYQRVLRLSPPSKEHNGRLGAAATGLASTGEVTIFDASKSRVDQSDVRQRINLGKEQEAADVDIIEANDYEYYVVYCTDYDIYLCKVPFNNGVAARSPYLLYEMQYPNSAAKDRRRSQFRSVKFLSARLLLVLVNLPNRSGAELLLLEISENPLLGTIALRKTLHKGTKAGSCLAVAHLPGQTPSENIQHVIAIAGADISITILTLDHNPRSRSSLAFKQHTFIRDAHPIQMTSLAFSYFSPPSDPIKAHPQYLKLASTSMSATVVVHTFSLIPFPSPVAKRRDGDPPTRYVLQTPSSSTRETASLSLSALVALITVALAAFFLQVMIEIRGGTPEFIGAKTWLSKPLHDRIALPWMSADQTHPVITDSLPPVESPLRKAYKVAGDEISSGSEKLKEGFQDTKEKIQETIQDHIPEDFDDLKETAQQAVEDHLPTDAEELQDSVHDRAREAQQVIRDRLPTDADQVRAIAQQAGRKTKYSALQHHRRLRNLLHHRHSLLGSHSSRAPASADDDNEAYDYESDPDIFSGGAEQSAPTILIRDHGHDAEIGGRRIAGELHESEEDLRRSARGTREHGRLRKWEDLRPHEKRSWMRKLEDAGIWTLGQGDAVLKGIFYSEIAGAVAGAVRGGL